MAEPQVDTLDTLIAELDRFRARLVAEKARRAPSVTIKVFSEATGIAYDAALKRAQRSVSRGDGNASKIGGQFYFMSTYLDMVLQGRGR